MKKKSILLATLILILVVLGAASVLLLRTREESSPTEEATPIIPLYEFSSPVRSIEISASGKAPFIIQNLCDDEYRPQDTLGAVIVGWEDLQLLPDRTATLFHRAKSLSAIELLFEGSDDYSPFELDPPRTQVKAISIDGEEAIFLIGKEEPGGRGVYVQLEAKPEIYLIPSIVVDYFFLTPVELITLTVTSDKIGDTPFASMIISGPTCGQAGEKIILEATDTTTTYTITYPVVREVDKRIQTMLQNLLYLKAESIVSVHPSPEELSTFGFDKPYAIVEAGSEENAFILHFTEPNTDGTTYVRRTDRPVLYRIAASDTQWMGKNYFDLMSKIVLSPDINDLFEVSIETPESRYTFTLTVVDSRLSVTANGSLAIDTGDFRRFFQSLCTIKYDETSPEAKDYPAFDRSSSPPDLSILYRYIDGHIQTVSFFEGPLRRYYTYVNDGTAYLTSTVYVEQVVQDVRMLVSN